MDSHTTDRSTARIPDALHPLLTEYRRLLDQFAPIRVTAFYLEGSIALDGFQPGLSDVDFIAVLSSPPAEADRAALEAVHRQLAELHPQPQMSGMYFQPGDLGRRSEQLNPFLNYHDGRLAWAKDFPLSSVTWWILRNRGIALFGPPAQSLTFSVDMDSLLQTQRRNLRTYWASWTTRPDGILALLTDWGVQWTVLGVLRQFYTLRERQITSKVRAGEYALTCLPDRWHPIIREAIALRHMPGQPPYQSPYRSRFTRAVDAYRFLKYLMKSQEEKSQ